MAVKFPLKMSDGTPVRTMEELRENFDLEAVLGYYSNGRLIKWLEDRYYNEEAGAVRALKTSSKTFNQKLCEILGVTYSEKADKRLRIGDIKKKNERYELLKSYTTDETILSMVDDIAYTQEELDALVKRIDSLEMDDDGNRVIYLCGEHFIIPKDIGKVTYKGINNSKVEFDEIFDEDGVPEPANAGIDFQNLKFSFDDYVTEYKDLDDNGSIGWVMFSRDFENNPDLAIRLIRISAENGSTEAWLALGECYNLGFGVEKDIREAVKWYQKAADQKNEYAKEQLSLLSNLVKSEEMLQKYEDEQKRLVEQGDADL